MYSDATVNEELNMIYKILLQLHTFTGALVEKFVPVVEPETNDVAEVRNTITIKEVEENVRRLSVVQDIDRKKLRSIFGQMSYRQQGTHKYSAGCFMTAYETLFNQKCEFDEKDIIAEYHLLKIKEPSRKARSPIQRTNDFIKVYQELLK